MPHEVKSRRPTSSVDSTAPVIVRCQDSRENPSRPPRYLSDIDLPLAFTNSPTLMSMHSVIRGDCDTAGEDCGPVALATGRDLPQEVLLIVVQCCVDSRDSISEVRVFSTSMC